MRLGWSPSLPSLWYCFSSPRRCALCLWRDLGAVLVVAGLSLIDIRSVLLFYRIDRTEAFLSVLATLGVVAVGAVNAIFFAVVLALLRFIKLMSRPRVEILGEVEGLPGLHSLERHEGAQVVPGMELFRFNSPITFFNAPYFKREPTRAVDEAGPNLRHVVIGLPPVASIDATGLLTVTELVPVLGARGVGLNAAGRATEWANWVRTRGFATLLPNTDIPHTSPSSSRAVGVGPAEQDCYLVVAAGSHPFQSYAEHLPAPRRESRRSGI